MLYLESLLELGFLIQLMLLFLEHSTLGSYPKALFWVVCTVEGKHGAWGGGEAMTMVV